MSIMRTFCLGAFFLMTTVFCCMVVLGIQHFHFHTIVMYMVAIVGSLLGIILTNR